MATTLENSVEETEGLARQSAKQMMKQSRQVLLLDKKATAIGKTVISIDDNLDNVNTHINTMYGTMEKVIEGQDTLTTQSDELNTSWINMSETQRQESESIKQAKESLIKLNELKEVTLAELQTIAKDQVSRNENDIQYFKTLFDELKEQLITADNGNEIINLETAVNGAMDKINDYQNEQQKRTDEMNNRISRIERVTGLLTHAVSQYETLLKTMNAKVIYISTMVDSVDKHISSLSQSGLNMSDDDILQLFENYTPEEKEVEAIEVETIEVDTMETKSVETKSAAPESEPEVQDDELGSNDIDTDVQESNIGDINEDDEWVSGNHHKKKKIWEFWK